MAVMAGGCSSQPEQNASTELQTLEILDIEEVSEIPAEFESEEITASEEETAPPELVLGAGQEETETVTEESTDHIAESETEDAAGTAAQSETMAAASGKTGKETEEELPGETAWTDKKTGGKESENEAETKAASSGVQKAEETEKASSGAQKTTETGKQEQTEPVDQTEKSEQTEETELSEEKAGTESRDSAENTSRNEKETAAQELSQTEAGENIGETEVKAETAYPDETENVSEAESETAYPDETENVSEAETEMAYPDETENASEAETETVYSDETENIPEAETERSAIGLHVAADRVNVREEPSTEAEKITTLNVGEEVLCLSEEEDWSRIRFESAEGIRDGYVKTEFLAEIDQLYAATEKVNVRKEASTESDKVGALEAGDETVVLEVTDGWAKVRFYTETGVIDAYVKAEFLARAEQDTSEDPLAQEAEQLAALRKSQAENPEDIEDPEDIKDTEDVESTDNIEGAEADGKESELGAPAVSENETETEVSSEAKQETEVISEAEQEPGVSLETESEPETTSEIKPEPEDESEMKASPETESEPESTLETESEPESAERTAEASESETEISSETETEVSSETEAEESPASETEASSVSESESSAESASDQESAALELTEGAEAQYQLAKLLFPEAGKVGILYSEKNTAAASWLKVYEELADTYEMELTAMSIEEEADIDFAASELVGSVDCIFCMEDSVIDELLQTVRAYADEVEIPVIGISGEQVEKGSLVAFDGSNLHWNTAEGEKLGKSAAGLTSSQLIEH